jgi:ribosomal protein L29
MPEEGEGSVVRVKSREDYSRNVKKLKVKLLAVREESATMQRRV